MPELPEVEMVRRVLGPQLAGKSICAVRLITPGVIAHPRSEEFVEGVVGRRVAGMESRGRCLQLVLEGGGRVVVHFRMTGCLLRFTAADLADVMEKHTHVIFELDDGSVLWYSDQRRFGRLWLVEDVETATSGVDAANADTDTGAVHVADVETAVDKKGSRVEKSGSGLSREMSAAGLRVTGMDKLGLEPFDTGMTWKYLRDKLGGRRICIKEGLLDQGVVAGIGNIYSDEILFASRIYPGREARTLTVAQWKRLAAQIPVTMEYYIEKNEISPEDYLKGRGKDYRNTPYLRVYGQKEKPCPNCRTRLEGTRIGGRSSVYCPKCQKM